MEAEKVKCLIIVLARLIGIYEHYCRIFAAPLNHTQF